MEMAKAMSRCWAAWFVSVVLSGLSVAGVLILGAGNPEVGPPNPVFYGVLGLIYFVLIAGGGVLHWQMIRAHWAEGQTVRPAGYLKARLFLWAGLTLAAVTVFIGNQFQGIFLPDLLLVSVPALFVLWTFPKARALAHPARDEEEAAIVEENEILNVQK